MPSTPPPRIEIVENKGQNTLRQTLVRQILHADRLSLASAFVTLPALRRLLPGLRKVAMRHGVRIITGLYNYMTEPDALWVLLKLQEETSGKLSARISRDSRYHRKFYLVDGKTTEQAYIGSSNLTSSGLTSGGELTVCLALPLASKASRALHNAFDSDFSSAGSAELTERIIAKYEAQRNKQFKRQPTPSQASISSILGAKKTSPTPPTLPRCFWRNYFDYYMKPETRETIDSLTDWERKGWDFYVDDKADSYRPDDRVLLLDLMRKVGEVIEIKEVTEFPTRDGRYHRAYGRLAAYRTRKLTPRFKTELAKLGVLPSRASLSRKAGLSDATWASLLPLFKKKRRRNG